MLIKDFKIKDFWLIFVGGGLAALINLFRMPLFFEAEFVFGGFIVLLIAVFRGPWVALLASFIATTPLVLAWGNFWPVLTFGIEAIFVGIICSRSKFNVIVVVIVYWLFIGMPISWYSISRYEYFVDSHRTSILIKQLTNGILYAHIASLFTNLPVIKKYFVRKDSEYSFSIKEQSSHVISSLLITIGIIFFFFNLNQNIKYSTKQFNFEHDSMHNELKHKLKLSIESKIKAMDEFKYNLAEVWDDDEKRHLSLLAFNQRHPEFRTMILTDKSADLINSSPPELVQNVLAQNESVNVADRAYFKEAIKTSSTFVSPGFVGRVFGSDLIAAISVGIPESHSSDENVGVLEGAFILTSVKHIQKLLNTLELNIQGILIDQTGKNLIASEFLQLEPLIPVSFSQAENSFYSNNLFHVVNNGELNSDDDYYLKSSKFNWGWELVTLLNEEMFAKVIERTLIIFAISIILLVLIAKLVALLISNSWSYSLQRLNRLIVIDDSESIEIAEFESDVHLPEEVNNLYQEIKNSRLKILQMNKELQNTVAERTEKLKTANEKLNVMARHDDLTNLENRRVFKETLSALWHQSYDAHATVSMMIIDIDHFKRVNDSYGHPAGDEVLIQLSRILEKFSNPAIQCLSRIGGEEFCLLAKGLQSEDVKNLAEEIKKLVEISDFTVASDQQIKITVSIGVATISPSKVSADKLYQLADNALYEAKNAGRNCVVSKL